ncbi:MAG TPA: ABC transporter permease [Ignavibacteriaceae bacterium]|nr:ABC transporter permease [Ignavibacteriaceae bacterium]
MARKLTTFITIAGIALVVFVFTAVLMMAFGIQKTLVSTGSADNVMITRKAANAEISSIIGPDIQNVIRTLPHIAKEPDGNLVISDEPVVIVNLEKQGGGVSNITVRGVSPEINQLRPQVKIIQGRMFTWGLRELIVGDAIVKRFPGAQLGSYIKFAGGNWKIVGIFTTNGSGFDSEIWGDALQLLSAFNRGSTVSTVTLKLDNPENYDAFKKAFNLDLRLQQYEPIIEQKYFAQQSEMLSTFIRVLGIFITIIFSLGATIGATITMYSAVANRTVEIGTLRSLGFNRRSILSAFLLESLFITLAGGVIGIFLASFLQFFSISTLNFSSFSELAFSFALSPAIIVSSLVFAIIMGFVGGFLPSVRAARMNIVTALRAG